MICEQCHEEGKTSQVYPGVGSRTLVYSPPFYDENGAYHDHDPNITTYSYSCSNGHTWSEKHGPAPCWCGWPNKAVSDELE